MVKVIPFPIPDDMIWTCDCGNQSFFVYSTGEVECASCGDFADDEVQDVVPRKQVRMIDDDTRNQWTAIAEQLNITMEE